MSVGGLIFDPLMLVWDEVDFRGNPSKFWGMAGDIVGLFDIVDELQLQVAMAQDLSQVLVSRFPASLIDMNSGELRDFVNSVYFFLASVSGHEAEVGDDFNVDFSPNIFSVEPFLNDQSLRRGHSLSFFLDRKNDIGCVYATHDAVWSWGDSLEAVFLGAITTYGVLKPDGYDNFKNNSKRFYEEHKKHDSAAGYGSRLPVSLSDEDMQRLLDAAASITDDENCYCVFNNREKIYIVFRRHFRNLYHGYPICDNEISRMRLNRNDIPIVDLP